MKTLSGKDKLRQYAERSGIARQKILAAKLGIHESYVSLYLSGQRTFGAKTALRVSRITGIPMEELYQ